MSQLVQTRCSNIIPTANRSPALVQLLSYVARNPLRAPNLALLHLSRMNGNQEKVTEKRGAEPSKGEERLTKVSRVKQASQALYVRSSVTLGALGIAGSNTSHQCEILPRSLFG